MAPTLSAPILRAALLALLTGAMAAPASACRLALALGFDVSRSVGVVAFELQRAGIDAALADEAVRAAILNPDEPVALAAFYWSGAREQVLVADWTLMNGPADIDGFAARIRDHPRSFDGFTGLGAAMDYGRRLLERAPPECLALTLDIAGDGRNNDGPTPAQVLGRGGFDMMLINGLAIGGIESDIAAYFAREVIHGPGAFVQYANRPADFPEAFRRKLLRELSEQVLGEVRPTRRGRGQGAISNTSSTVARSATSPSAIGTGAASASTISLRIDIGRGVTVPASDSRISGPSPTPAASAYSSALRRASATALRRAASIAGTGSDSENVNPASWLAPSATTASSSAPSPDRSRTRTARPLLAR